MSRLKQRKNTWFADFTVNGMRVVRTTGIKVGDDPEASRIVAQQQANTMEQVANGKMSLNVALNAVRACAKANGIANAAPSIREYLTSGYKPRGGSGNIAGFKRAATLLLEHLGALANRPLDQLSVSECSDFLASRLRVASYGTVALHKSLLSAAFNVAVADDLIPKNPWTYARLDRIAPKDMPRKLKRLPFTAHEMHVMLTEFASPWKELVAISFLTGGQRIGDICCLRWDSVDFAHGTITFSSQKTAHVITCPIIAPLREVLDGLYKPNEEYVLPELAGMYMACPGKPSTYFTSMLRAHGIESVTSNAAGAGRNFSQKSFHSIRHTVVSMLRSSNKFSQDLTRQIVGHNSEEVERQYFTADMDAKQQGIEYLFSQVKNPAPFPPYKNVS